MKRLFAAATGFALVAVLAACDGEPAKEPPKKSDDDGSAYAVGPGDEYVAIGDSYTAAPATGPADGTDGCARSLTNYPHLVAEATGATLSDNSCSGATTEHLRQPQQTPAGRHPPQLSGVGTSTDLLTIRLGGNDYGVFARLVRCAYLGAARRSGRPCTNADAAAGVTSLGSRLEEIQTNLVRALEEIADRAPQARVIVVGYPEIVPVEGTCGLLPLPDGDYAWARRINEGLNDALASAAADREVEFVDVAAATEGHDICSGEPWIAGIRATRGRATPWHPYPEESQVVAEQILDELQ